MKKVQAGLLAAFSFVMLTGYHGGCRDHSIDGRTKRIDRYASNALEDVMEELDASAQQMKLAFNIKDDLMKDVPLQLEAQERSKELLRQQWQEERADPAVIHLMIDERARSITSFVHKLADGLIELHATLNPKQRKEVQQMWD